MSRDEYLTKLDELLNFAYARRDAYVVFSDGHGIWSRVAANLEEAKREFPE